MNAQTPAPPPEAHHRFDSAWWLRWGVIILAVLVVLVFGTESTLALLRRRDVVITLSVQSVNPMPTPTTTPTGAAPGGAETATPAPAVLTLLPSERVIVNVRWNYHIGPRFPHTAVHASAVIDGRDVADGQVNIDCDGAVIDCTGQGSMTLAYTVPDTGNGSGSQTVDWPAGDYTVVVDRSDGGLNPVVIGRYPFRVPTQPPS